jgi:hypothetical protein
MHLPRPAAGSLPVPPLSALHSCASLTVDRPLPDNPLDALHYELRDDCSIEIGNTARGAAAPSAMPAAMRWKGAA